MNDWIEVFKTGMHTDSKGNTREWTEADLDRMIETYDPKDHEAPAVIGHPKEDKPAYGWVEALKRDGKLLLAKFRQCADGFVEAVKTGRYKKRSIAVYADGTLRHVGFLGAVPPAVKGLADIKFRTGEEFQEFEFDEASFRPIRWALENVAELFRSVRDLLIEKYGTDAAEKALPTWKIESVEVEPPSEGEGTKLAPAVGFSEKKEEEEKMEKELKEKLTAAEEALKASEKKLQEFAEGGKRSDDEILKLKRELALRDVNARLDKLQAEKKITPAMRELGLAEFMAGLGGETVIEFGEGKKSSSAEIAWKVLEAFPPVVEFGEKAKKPAEAPSGGSTFSSGPNSEVDAGRLEIHEKAVVLAAQEKIPYAEAVSRVMKK